MTAILDRQGNPYQAARSNRLTAQLPTTHRPSDEELANGTLRTLRSRSRFIFNNHAHASGALRHIVRRVAGWLRIQARLRSAGDGGGYLREENEALEALWRERERQGLSTMGHKGRKFWRLILQTLLVDGEVFLIRTQRAVRAGVTREWQVLGGDMLPDDLNERNGIGYEGIATGNTVRMGVELTRLGRPVAYHFFADGHTASWAGAQGGRKLKRIPADQVIHWHRGQYADAPRGVPILTPVILKLADLDEFFAATLTQAWAQASVMAFIKTMYASERLESRQGRVGVSNQDATYSPTRWMEEMSPGTIKYLLENEEMQFADPKAPSGNIDPFSKVILRAIAAGVGVSYEALARDYTQTNYSSGRQTENEDAISFTELSMEMDEEVVDPVWRDHVDHVYLINRLRTAPGEVADLYAHIVQHPVKDYADPLKQVKADLAEIEGRISSRQAICAKRGRDFYEVIDALADEARYMDERGVTTAAMAATIEKIETDEPQQGGQAG